MKDKDIIFSLTFNPYITPIYTISISKVIEEAEKWGSDWKLDEVKQIMPYEWVAIFKKEIKDEK